MSNVYIVMVFDNIRFFYEPLHQCWYPEINIDDFDMFKIPYISHHIHKKQAVKLWGDAGGQVLIIDVEPPLYS